MNLTFQQRVLYTVSVTLASVVLLLLAWQLKNVLLTIFAAFTLAVFFNACALGVRYVTRLPRGWSLLVAILLLVGLGVLGSVLLLPAVITQLNELFRSVPTLLTELQATLERTSWGQSLLRNVPDSSEMTSELGSVFSGVGSTVSITVNSLTTAVFIVVIAVFFAAQPKFYQQGIIRLVPRKFEARAKKLLGEVSGTLQGWLIGQAIAMSAVAVLTAVGLSIAGVPLALALGIIAGLLDIIPFFGPVLAAIPAILIGFTEGLWTGVWAAVISLIVQQLEANVIQPLVQRRAVQIPPALLVISLIVMSKLFGFLGLLVATPFAAVVLLLIKHLYVEGLLGKKAPSS